MNDEKLEIIIDGANIFHDDRGIRIFDEVGEKITQSRPERLAAAISFVRGKVERLQQFSNNCLTMLQLN